MECSQILRPWRGCLAYGAASCSLAIAMRLESAENLDFSIRNERQKQTASTLHRTFAQFANDFIFFQCAQLLHFYLPVLSYWLPIYFMWNEIRAKASKTRLFLVFWNYSYIFFLWTPFGEHLHIVSRPIEKFVLHPYEKRLMLSSRSHLHERAHWLGLKK